jgi:hypothetical protein
MSFTVNGDQVPIGEINFYSDGFRNLFENHIPFLKNDLSTKKVFIAPHDEVKYIGDLYGMLQSSNVSQDLWWCTMRLNGLHSPISYNGDLGFFLLPSRTKLEELARRFLNTLTVK